VQRYNIFIEFPNNLTIILQSKIKFFIKVAGLQTTHSKNTHFSLATAESLQAKISNAGSEVDEVNVLS